MAPLSHLSRWKLAVSVIATAGLISACTTLPRDSEPQALRTFESAVQDDVEIGPENGQEPDLLLRDFYRSSASPEGNYRVAKMYLTDEAADQWQPNGEDTLVVDRVEFNTASGNTNSDTREFNVRGTVIGKLGSGGKYQPEDGLYETTIEMELVNDQWRIASLPSGVVIERNELRNKYQPQALYFFDKSGSVLVSDRRWVHSGQESLGAGLVTMLMEGPSSRLSPAVEDIVPAEAAFVGLEDGVYKFTGMPTLTPEQRLQFAGQLVWTLANAAVPGPYRVLIDEAPVADGLESLSTDDFADLNPRVASSTVAPLYALRDGVLSRVASDEETDLDNEVGAFDDISAADVTSDGVVAVVRSEQSPVTRLEQSDEVEEPGSSELYIGELDGDLEYGLSEESITRPTIEYDGGAVWVATKDRRVVRIVRSVTSAQLTQGTVDTSSLEDISGEISVLRLSKTGALVAMIIDGHIYTGVVQLTTDGERKIVNVQEIASEIGGTALSLDWQPDGSLIVGTSTADSPVWRVEQDGSAVSSLPSGNVTAPVVAVAASPSTIYITDAHATLQLPASGTDSSFWREVPGLQGQRSVPVVAN